MAGKLSLAVTRLICPTSNLFKNRWSNDGIDYWASLTIHQTESRIGVRWSNTNGPTRNEKDYMDRLLRQLSDNPEKNEILPMRSCKISSCKYKRQ